MLIILIKNGNEITFWDTVTKTVVINTNPINATLRNYVRPQGELVDAYQLGNTVHLILANFYTGTRITYNNSFLLNLRNETPNFKTTKWFATDSRTVHSYRTSRTDPNSSVYNAAYDAYRVALNNYTRSTTDIFFSSCLGTTQRAYASDGLGGVSFSTVQNSIACGYVTPTNGAEVTEKLTVKIDNACYDNPFLLRWKNLLGGWDNYMFSFNQKKSFQTKNIGRYEVAYTDIQLANSFEFDRGKNVVKTMIIGADNVSIDNLNAIMPDLLVSQSVSIVNLDGTETRIKVAADKVTINTRDTHHTIELEIEFPSINTVTQ